MNEAEIRMQAQMYALVAEMHGIVSGVEGMKAANEERKANGFALAYAEQSFAEAEEQLRAIAKKLREGI